MQKPIPYAGAPERSSYWNSRRDAAAGAESAGSPALWVEPVVAYAASSRSARTAEWARLYLLGHTMQQIGDSYGCTREHVRQVLGAAGVFADTGGAALRVARNRERQAELKRLSVAKRCAERGLPVGVYPRGNRYWARAGSTNIRGSFATPELAAAAREAMVKQTQEDKKRAARETKP